MPSWIMVSVLVVFAVIFFVFVLPALLPKNAVQEMTLEKFCSGYGMMARQKFFSGITQCYSIKVEGHTTSETACNVEKVNSTWRFRDACLLEMPPVEIIGRGK
jgi:hypothetical protein